jgi:hypothetical protein
VLENVHDGSGVVGTVAGTRAGTGCGGRRGMSRWSRGGVGAASGSARRVCGDESNGEVAADWLGFGADLLGFGAAKRAERLYEAAREAKALGIGRWFGKRWLQNGKAWVLRGRAGVYWFSGMSIDIGGLGYDWYDSTSTIAGEFGY